MVSYTISSTLADPALNIIFSLSFSTFLASLISLQDDAMQKLTLITPWPKAQIPFSSHRVVLPSSKALLHNSTRPAQYVRKHMSQSLQISVLHPHWSSLLHTHFIIKLGMPLLLSSVFIPNLPVFLGSLFFPFSPSRDDLVILTQRKGRSGDT